MHSRSAITLSRIPRGIFCAVLIVLIFTGVLALLIAALALISCGILALPTALIRIIGLDSLFVTDVPVLTTLFSSVSALSFGTALLLVTTGRVCPWAASYIFAKLYKGGRK